MKTRIGFVSNSSSTSFCIYGMEIDDDDFINLIMNIKKMTKGEAEEYIEEHELYELFEEFIDKNLELDHFGDSDVGYYIGKSFTTIKDNETGKQFKDNIENKLKNSFGKNIKCSIIEESYYS